MRNNNLRNSKRTKSQMRAFDSELTKNDTIAFAFLAAEQGLTPSKLMASFVHDIVSSFYSTELTQEEKHLLDWFSGSWFSQDNDGYFSFLQYVVRNNHYKFVSSFLAEQNKTLKSYYKEKISVLFNEYCIKNPAHKSFIEELEVIRRFDNNIHNFSKGGKRRCRY